MSLSNNIAKVVTDYSIQTTSLSSRVQILPKPLALTVSNTVPSPTTTATVLDSTTHYSNGVSIKKTKVISFTEKYTRY